MWITGPIKIIRIPETVAEIGTLLDLPRVWKVIRTRRTAMWTVERTFWLELF